MRYRAEKQTHRQTNASENRSPTTTIGVGKELKLPHISHWYCENIINWNVGTHIFCYNEIQLKRIFNHSTLHVHVSLQPCDFFERFGEKLILYWKYAGFGPPCVGINLYICMLLILLCLILLFKHYNIMSTYMLDCICHSSITICFQ